MNKRFKRAAWLLAGGTAALALLEVGYVAITWYRYGHDTPDVTRRDPLLDQFMPAYEIAERHETRVEAQASITYAAACALDLQRSRVVRALIKTRELVMRSQPKSSDTPRALGLRELTAIGWGVLAEEPGHEIVMGAITQPWRADVTFRRLPPDEFAAFNTPGYVKIAWTISAEPIGPEASVFHTETGVVTTDAKSRRRFRRYWSIVSPGILLIRYRALALVKADAEHRAASVTERVRVRNRSDSRSARRRTRLCAATLYRGAVADADQ